MNESNHNITIGANIKALREKANLQHKEVYEYLKISRSMLAKIEKGQTSVSPDKIINLCILLKCTPNDIFKKTY